MRQMIFMVLGVFLLTADLVAQQDKVKWYSMEEAVAATRENPKKIFIDIYTTWCGWCKKMDATTFKHPQIVKYLNTYFYPVKLNAEGRDTIKIGNQTFVNPNAKSGKKGTHQLAAALLKGKMSYPSYAFMDGQLKLLFPLPGYKKPADLEKYLVWVYTEAYKDESFEDWVKTFEGKIGKK